MRTLDYNAMAELYPGKRAKFTAVRYRRFDTAAEAVRFAIEEMRPELLNGSLLEVDERRFDGAEIRALYDAADYPLPRQVAEAA